MAGGGARFFFFQMINRFRKASVVNTNTITIWFFLYRKCVLPKASRRYISPCCSLIFFFFWTYSRESLAHLPSVSLGERGFVLLYARPLTPIMCSSHPWCQMKWQAASARGCNTFWYEVFHQVLFSSRPLKSLNVWHWWLGGTVGLVSICLIFELTGTCC